jgi:hypothetical protein
VITGAEASGSVRQPTERLRLFVGRAFGPPFSVRAGRLTLPAYTLGEDETRRAGKP